MKVICINRKGRFDERVLLPEIGSEYTVVTIIAFLYHGRPMQYYVLSELGKENAYACILFAPTDGPDEKEMAEERQREMVERMDRSWKVIGARIDETLKAKA